MPDHKNNTQAKNTCTFHVSVYGSAPPYPSTASCTIPFFRSKKPPRRFECTDICILGRFNRPCECPSFSKSKIFCTKKIMIFFFFFHLVFQRNIFAFIVKMKASEKSLFNGRGEKKESFYFQYFYDRVCSFFA